MMTKTFFPYGMSVLIVFIFLFLPVETVAAPPQITNPMTMAKFGKLLDSDGASNNGFAYSVAVSGDILVIGRISFLHGKVNIFQYSTTSHQYEQVAQLIPSDISTGDFFGITVAISGNTIVVGASGDENKTGSAYVFVEPAGGWRGTLKENAKLSASDAFVGNEFGRSVAISGDTVVVGSLGDQYNSGQVYIFCKPAGGWSGNLLEQAIFIPSDPQHFNIFGHSVAISGDTVVAGAPDAAGSTGGSVYILEKPVGGWNGTLTETAKLSASDADPGAGLGISVDFTGDTLVVGADDNSDIGSAYVYVKPAGGWQNMSEDAKLTPSDGSSDDKFGTSVAIGGDTIVVGAAWDDSKTGSAYIFVKPAGGWSGTLIETSKLKAPDASPGDSFGYSIAVGDDMVLVGAPFADDLGSDSGSAYIYRPTIVTDIPEHKKIAIDIKAIDPNPGDIITYSLDSSEDSDNFVIDHGNGVIRFVQVPDYEQPRDSNLDNTYKLLVSVHDDFGESSFNPLWVRVTDLEYEGPTPNPRAFKEQQNVRGTTTVSDDNCGYSVALSGDTLVIAAPFNDYTGQDSGIAYVFQYSHSLKRYRQVARLTPSDGSAYDYFGNSVAIDGNTVVVGAYGDDDSGSTSGSAYLFSRPANGWSSMHESAKLTASDATGGDHFGYSVAIDGDTVVVGAYGDGDFGISSGSAYLFSKPAGGWVGPVHESAKLTPSDGEAYDYFGYSVAIDGNTVVVGAYGDGDFGIFSGSAYLFSKPAGGWVGPVHESAKLTSSDGAAYDYFGYSVAIDGNTVVVGAYGDDDSGDSSGSVYLFRRPDSGWKSMMESAKLMPSDGAAYDYFGYRVAIDGDTVVVGAYGDDDSGDASGSAYLFSRPFGGWTRGHQNARLSAADGEAHDFFGSSVAVSGNTVVIGAKGDKERGTGSGSAYIFQAESHSILYLSLPAILRAGVGKKK